VQECHLIVPSIIKKAGHRYVVDLEQITHIKFNFDNVVEQVSERTKTKTAIGFFRN